MKDKKMTYVYLHMRIRVGVKGCLPLLNIETSHFIPLKKSLDVLEHLIIFLKEMV